MSKGNFRLKLTAVLLLALLHRLILLPDFPLSVDEGFHILWVRLAQAGYHFYSEIFVSYPPLYPLALLAAWHIWPDESSLRLVTILCALGGLAAVALVTRRLTGDLAGLLAALMLAIAPRFLLESGGILGETPSVALAAVSIALAWRYRAGGGRAYLVLSALVQSAALLLKMLPVMLTPLVPLVVMSRWAEGLPGKKLPRQELISLGREALKDLALWTAAFLLPVLPFLFIYDPAAMYDQVFAFRFSAREAYEERQLQQFTTRAGDFALENPALLLLALYGSLELIRKKRWDSWPLLGWLLLACATVVLQTPVRTKHFVVVLFPVSILAGVGMGRAAEVILPQFWPGEGGPGVLHRALVALAVVFYLVMVPVSLAGLSGSMTGHEPLPEYREALDVVRQATVPGDYIVCDDSRFAVWAERLVPPELAEVSNVRLESGYLSRQQLIEETEAYGCRAVVMASGRFRKYSTDYAKWAEETFPERRECGEVTIFLRQK